MDYFAISYTALGGLGIFFLGMKILSESLQSIAGEVIKRLISAVTSNRFMAVIVGLVVTTIVQSSSVSTVMVVGMINAGLMNLTQAIGVIFGANIGTTITGWILAVKIGKYGLLLIGLGIFPMLFARSDRYGSYGRVTVALGLVFLGLETMSGAFKPLRGNADFLHMMQYFDAQSLGTILGCIVIGCLLTFIVQSSSAMLGITIALASTGAISFPTAAALVLGENIGTTITAQLAAIGGNVGAKRAALSHTIFNVIGVVVVVSIFPYYLEVIDSLMPGDPGLLLEDGSNPFIAAHIALGHTLFNICATIVALPFLNVLAQFVTRLIPDTGHKEVHHLKYIRSGGAVSAGVSINMASMELMNLSDITKRTLANAREYILSENLDKNLMAKVVHLEQVTDNIQDEITEFLCQALEGRLSREQSSEAYSIIRAADELESIADQALALCEFRNRLAEKEQTFSDDAWQQLREFLDQTLDFYTEVTKNLALLRNGALLEKHMETVHILNVAAEKMRELHLQRMTRGECNPLAAMAYSDMVVALRRVKNHTINFIEAAGYQLTEQQQKRLIASVVE